jgi:hypothetical protein
MLDSVKESSHLDFLKAKFELDAYNVITEDPLFDSEKDLVDKICRENSDQEKEIVYCKLSWLDFVDSETDGCDDDPVVRSMYGAHLFWEYKEPRSDGSTPEQDLKDLILRLRNRFLADREIGDDAEHTPLRGVTNIILGEDPLTGVFGYYKDVALDVTVE